VAQKLFWIAVAGGLGSLARYGLAGLVHRVYPGELPLGTAVVNVTGCFLFGLVWALAEQRLSISGEIRVILLVGFLGAFTTFSTFTFETGQLIRDAEWLTALGNVLAQLVLGVVCLFIGLRVGRFI